MVLVLFESAGKCSGGILVIGMAVDKAHEPGVKSSSSPESRRCVGHVAQPAQLGQGPSSATGGRSIGALRQVPGMADEVGQAVLPQSFPLAVDAEVVANQEAPPMLDEGGEGVGGSRACHEPEGLIIDRG